MSIWIPNLPFSLGPSPFLPFCSQGLQANFPIGAGCLPLLAPKESLQVFIEDTSLNASV